MFFSILLFLFSSFISPTFYCSLHLPPIQFLSSSLLCDLWLLPCNKKVKKIRLFTLPTYCGSDPMYSSSTKNWFHTQPRLTRWNPAAPFLIGPTKVLPCSLPVLLRPSGGKGGRKEKTEPSSTRIQRNSSRQFLVSIGDLWGSGPQVKVQWWELSHTEITCGGGYGEWVRQGAVWQTQRTVFLGLSGSHSEIYGAHHLKGRKQIHSLKGLLAYITSINDAMLLFLIETVPDRLKVHMACC